LNTTTFLSTSSWNKNILRHRTQYHTQHPLLPECDSAQASLLLCSKELLPGLHNLSASSFALWVKRKRTGMGSHNHSPLMAWKHQGFSTMVKPWYLWNMPQGGHRDPSGGK
jgi:hypothetical protein